MPYSAARQRRLSRTDSALSSTEFWNTIPNSAGDAAHVPVGILSAYRDGAAVLCQQSAHRVEMVVDLPAPLTPRKAEQLALPDVKGQVADRMDVPEGFVKMLYINSVRR